MKRTRRKFGSVVKDKRVNTWNFLWWEDGKRRSRLIGSCRDYPTKASAWKAARPLIDAMEIQADNKPVLTVNTLVEEYRAEKMPRRASTKRGYEAWLRNHVLPRWGARPLADLQARPVELWLQNLSLSPKSKVHIRGAISILWDYAMWRGAVPAQRNPMQLVKVKGASRRVRKPRSLTNAEFHCLLRALGDDVCSRTMVLLLVSFGLRISELLGLQWHDVDWLGKTIRIERAVVKQLVDQVKTSESAKDMVIADELLDLLKFWKQTTRFSSPEDWIFASPHKLGRQPLSYTHVWETLNDAAKSAGIGHVSSHCFRHTHRTWLDAEGTPVGVQQRMMRHADIRTTMNLYGDAITEDIRRAHAAVVRRALPGLTDCVTDCGDGK